MRKEICICDICQKERKVQEITYLVMFMTDQTEGRSVIY